MKPTTLHPSDVAHANTAAQRRLELLKRRESVRYGSKEFHELSRRCAKLTAYTSA